MTEEQKLEVKEETCKCFCKSEWFKKFLTIALGTFVGFYSALALFTALHKPPVVCPMRRPMICPPPIAKQNPFFHRPHRGVFGKQMVPPYRMHKKFLPESSRKLEK